MGWLGNYLKVVVHFVLAEGDRQDVQLYHCLVSLPQTPTNIPADSMVPHMLLFGPGVRGWYRPICLSGFSHFVIPVVSPARVSGCSLLMGSATMVMLKFATTFWVSTAL